MNDKLKCSICTNEKEWQAAKYYRQKYFFDEANIQDPYIWTFEHKDHKHFVLYYENQIIGYAHVQLWPEARAAIRIIVVDEDKRGNTFGSQFMHMIEDWIKEQGYKSIHVESRKSSLIFYQRLGYTEMPFNDPDGYESDPNDIPLGKIL